MAIERGWTVLTFGLLNQAQQPGLVIHEATLAFYTAAVTTADSFTKAVLPDRACIN